MKVVVLSLILLFGLGAAGYLLTQTCPDCPDPSRPWLRGSTEYSCAIPREIAQLRREHPDRTIKECACQHTCDRDADRATETEGRGWDYRCEARCNPHNCACPHPCES